MNWIWSRIQLNCKHLAVAPSSFARTVAGLPCGMPWWYTMMYCCYFKALNNFLPWYSDQPNTDSVLMVIHVRSNGIFTSIYCGGCYMYAVLWIPRVQTTITITFACPWSLPWPSSCRLAAALHQTTCHQVTWAQKSSQINIHTNRIPWLKTMKPNVIVSRSWDKVIRCIRTHLEYIYGTTNLLLEPLLGVGLDNSVGVTNSAGLYATAANTESYCDRHELHITGAH